MGLFESLFGKSESQTKLEREVSELKASLAAKEKSDAFLKALSNAGSVWVRKKSGTRQSHSDDPSVYNPSKFAHTRYTALLDEIFSAKKPRARYEFKMSPAGGGGYYLDIITEFEGGPAIFVFADGYRYDPFSATPDEFDAYPLSSKGSQAIQLEIRQILDKALLNVAKGEINAKSGDYGVVWMNNVLTGEKYPIFANLDNVTSAVEKGNSIKINLEHEVAGALLFVARGKDATLSPTTPFRVKFSSYAEDLFDDDELEDGCEKIDALYVTVIESIRKNYGIKAALECNVGAFSLTGTKLHAKNVAIDANNLMGDKNVAGILINTGILRESEGLESFRKATKIIQEVAMPSGRASLFDSDMDAKVRPTLDNFCKIISSMC